MSLKLFLMKSLRFVCAAILCTFLLIRCSSVRTTHDSPLVLNQTSVKKYPLNDEQRQSWYLMDPVADTIPGISLDRAVKFTSALEASDIVVGLIDSGVDIDHEDLNGAIWRNLKEIAGNGKDDDGNGYVDDVNGWNFLGGRNGNMYHAQLEITRILKKCDDSTSQVYSAAFCKGELYNEAKRIYTQRSEAAARQYNDIVQSNVSGTNNGALSERLKYLENSNRYYYNVDFEPRSIVGDDPDNIDDNNYGNNNVSASSDLEYHGTHVAGIIAANDHNNIGIKGVAHTAQLMVIRTTPDGDEYDKDVALAIRYAVDNGAKVVNMSFGKQFSPYRKWVSDAIRYAAEKDVLLVQSAGNDALNIDVNPVYPSDVADDGREFVDNVITVGSITLNMTELLVSPFSNYGKGRVDIFAPGSGIYATLPNNKYGYKDGTSMACPLVTGVAALIRSYYPMLTASQVKTIIMHGGMKVDHLVIVPGSGLKAADFSNLSVSGRILNAYNALLLADEEVKKESSLIR